MLVTPRRTLASPARRSVVMPPEGTTFADGIPVRPTPLGMATPHMQLGDTPAETKLKSVNGAEITVVAFVVTVLT